VHALDGDSFERCVAIDRRARARSESASERYEQIADVIEKVSGAGLSRADEFAIGSDWAQVPMVLITGHRRENFGDGIDQICKAIAALARRFPDHRFVYPVHLNPNVLVHVNRLLGNLPNVKLIAPQGYRNFVALMARSRLVMTDSGGVQEEAPSLGKPVLVMRDTTERPEGVAAGTALLTGPNAATIEQHATRLLSDEAAYRSMATARNPYGDGYAAERIVENIRRYFAASTLAPSMVPDRAELDKAGAASAAKTAAAT